MNRTTVTFLVILLLAAGCAWLAPGAAVQPGRLLAAHANLHDDCLACHVIGRGVTWEKCAACHEPEGIGLRTADGVALAKPRPAVQGLHQRSSKTACVMCHAEHAGRLGERAAARFTHERLPRDLVHDCASCHDGQQPTDVTHRAAGSDCAACHTTGAWTPAAFAHELLGAASPACTACHAARRPADELHGGLAPASDCAPCHQSRAWKPAAYDHARWFRFDAQHPARCADCHQPGLGYRHYSCTGCHAHSPARVAAEHGEEGIRDTRDCVKCHRGGDEGEGGEHEGERESRHEGGEGG